MISASPEINFLARGISHQVTRSCQSVCVALVRPIEESAALRVEGRIETRKTDIVMGGLCEDRFGESGRAVENENEWWGVQMGGRYGSKFKRDL